MNRLVLILPFLLLGISLVGQALKQHQVCHAVKENQILTADCANCSLPAVPVYLPTNIWQLFLDHNRLDFVRPLAHFSKYVNLRKLTLGNNSLTSIPSETFKYLIHLQHLNLWGNRLTEVPSSALRELRALRSLSLEGNHIRTIKRDAFYNLNNLTVLKLSGNHIYKIEAGAFTGLVKLQHLEIQHNALHALPSSLLEDLHQNLQTFLLYSNPWNCDCKIRWLVEYIKSVHLNWTDRLQIPRCDTPISWNSPMFPSVDIARFACPVIMDSSSININVEKGENLTLMCKVQSDPLANISWYFKDRLLKTTDGYLIEYTGGVNNQNSMLFIENLNPQNVGQYRCVARNPISEKCVNYTLALEGVQFFTQLIVDKKSSTDEDSTNIMVAVVTVCVLTGVIFLGLMGFIFWRRFTKIQKQREEELKLKIKKHFESNGGYKLDTDNKKCPPDQQMDNDEMDPFYDSLKKPPLDNTEPLFEKMERIPNGGTYMSFRTDPLDSEVNAPSTILTNLDSQSDNNGMFWTETSRNNTSSNLSELACPLLDQPTGYNSGTDTWDHSSEVFPQLYHSSYPRHPDTFYSVPSFHPYSHDSSNSMHSPYDTDTLPKDSVYNRSFSTANSQSGSEDSNKRSISVGSLGLVAIPPKKPPRLHSCSSISQTDTLNKMTLPKPGSIDEFGTAV